ncbi:hypothetical protein A5780_30605 [Nocardia sp. 852002-20019_SCH5090214]|nr:hypothetical protein A5780_30605 [Nocardia sp. 852002-20019_SCH5090214]
MHMSVATGSHAVEMQGHEHKEGDERQRGDAKAEATDQAHCGATEIDPASACVNGENRTVKRGDMEAVPLGNSAR